MVRSTRGQELSVSVALICLFAVAVGCSQEPKSDPIVLSEPAETPSIELAATTDSFTDSEGLTETDTMLNREGLETATFAAGCYWCTEAVFQRLEGVENVVSGAMGGQVENPTYEDICTGTSGHAECIQFNYDPAKVRYEELLEVFWKTHDPTTLNMQGADIGTQYRSAIFYHTDEQRDLAEKYKAKLDAGGVFDHPIVTEITQASEFYSAKAGHQNFYNQNPNQGYCGYIIRPKIEKLEAIFADKLKKSE